MVSRLAGNACTSTSAHQARKARHCRSYARCVLGGTDCWMSSRAAGDSSSPVDAGVIAVPVDAGLMVPITADYRRLHQFGLDPDDGAVPHASSRPVVDPMPVPGVQDGVGVGHLGGGVTVSL